MSDIKKTVIQLQNVTKRYGKIKVLDSIQFDLRKGEVHGLIGENGAGKSTTMKLLAGVYDDYDGELLINGKSKRFKSPADAQNNGIGMVYQELSIFRHLSVAENLFSRHLPHVSSIVSWKQMNGQAQKHLTELGLDIDVKETMGNLPVGNQQMIEIAKVIFSGADVLILDEPTSALSPPETRRLFDFISTLKEQGRSIIFISHFLEDVLAVTDRISIFKNGKKIETLETQQTDKQKLVGLMIGTEGKILQQLYKERRPAIPKLNAGEVVFSVDGLAKRNDFSDVSFSISKGEILGIFGFMGAGQIGLARCLFGADQADQGSITLKGKKIKLKNTTLARNAGIAYVPENRHNALMLQQEVFKNITLAHLHNLKGWILNKKTEIKVAATQIRNLKINPPDLFLPVAALSGGNQQKVVLGKWLTQLPDLLILNEPTRGIDIGAKDEVLSIIQDLRAKGVPILLITSEPEIILAVADRAFVMSRGRITANLSGIELTKENLMQHA